MENNLCPKCGLPVRTNEWAAYRRHEDCQVKDLVKGDGRRIAKAMDVFPDGRVVRKSTRQG